MARHVLVCDSSTLTCAASPILRISRSSIESISSQTSAVEVGNRISEPGRKNVSRPGQLSEIIAAPQAAASNKRTEGEYPHETMSRRVTLSTNLEDEYKWRCQRGFKCSMRRTFLGDSTDFGYCGPARMNLRCGRICATSSNQASILGCRSAA